MSYSNETSRFLNYLSDVQFIRLLKYEFGCYGLLYSLNIIIIVISVFLIIVPTMLSIGYLTLVERKIMSAVQRRRGPNIIGFLGLLQPIADGFKLLTKEFTIPGRSFEFLLLATPIASLLFTFSCFAFVPFGYSFFYFTSSHVSALYIMAISSLNIYSIIMAGWASKSAYSFLGSLRASAQFISYEVSLTLNVMAVFLLTGSFDVFEIAYIQEQTSPNFLALFPIFILFFVGVLAETNRTPFDLAEAESELVAGYGVEYSAIGFTYFFLAEYGSKILYSILTVFFFFSGVIQYVSYFFLQLFVPLKWVFGSNNIQIFLNLYKVPEFFSFFVFGVQIALILMFFCYIRATYARYRFDQLMKLNWKNLLLISLALDLYVVVYLYISQLIFF